MIVGILGCSGCGGTFLDWTVHYLRGDIDHWTLQSNYSARIRNNDFITNTDRWNTYARLVTIPDDPLNKNTAHNHGKSHPTTETLPYVVDEFRQQPQDRVYTFYYMDSMTRDQGSTIHNDIVARFDDVKFIAYTYSTSSVDAICYLQLDKLPQMIVRYAETLDLDFTAMPVWEQREILSISYPKIISGQTLNETMQEHSNCFLLDFDNFFVDLPSKIQKIFEFLNFTIDRTRWNHWLSVYQKWQQSSGYQFYQDIDRIVDAIVSGQSVDLTKYSITFGKEVVIASKLLYNYNLALKSAGVADLTQNTQQWHSILEPNVYHNLEQDNI